MSGLRIAAIALIVLGDHVRVSGDHVHEAREGPRVGPITATKESKETIPCRPSWAAWRRGVALLLAGARRPALSSYDSRDATPGLDSRVAARGARR